MKSRQRATIGIIGILTAIMSTFFILSMNSELFSLIFIFLWFLGIILISWWYNREKNLRLKLSMGVMLSAQIIMFLFGKSYSDENNNIILFNEFYLFNTLLIGLGIFYFVFKTKRKVVNRQSFSNLVKNEILKKQKYKCAKCKKTLSIYDFDHKDDDRSNNSYSNCQALCLICHAVKTRKIKNKIHKCSIKI
ncbi:MAG TPA: HNH endonuclease signature motif containing protein [Nitrososphaeraceae archaeon]|nr:HNH endonuclease signature motif containing protein [Nitrososphaeraceae archaeon]